MSTRVLHPRIRLSLPGLLGAAVLALVLAARAGAGAHSDAPPIERPVMMDSNGPGSELYVLDDAGILHAYSVSENGLSEFGRISVPQGFSAADMSFLRSQLPASVLLAGTQGDRGLVLRLALDGRSLKSWGFDNVCAGVDSGASGHAAYVATSDSNDLYRVDPQNQQTIFVAHIPDASKLGPVAYDEAGQEIYIADVASGRIYEYSIASRSSKIFVTGLSAPTALAFDAESNRLFVADPGQRAIFAVDTRAAKPVAVPFASSPLRAPYGMTLISEDRVAVADYSANRIFVFSDKGALLFRYPAKP